MPRTCHSYSEDSVISMLSVWSYLFLDLQVSRFSYRFLRISCHLAIPNTYRIACDSHIRSIRTIRVQNRHIESWSLNHLSFRSWQKFMILLEHKSSCKYTDFIRIEQTKSVKFFKLIKFRYSTPPLKTKKGPSHILVRKPFTLHITDRIHDHSILPYFRYS